MGSYPVLSGKVLMSCVIQSSSTVPFLYTTSGEYATIQIIRNELRTISKHVPFLRNPRSNDPYTNHTTKNNILVFHGAGHGIRACYGSNLSCERMHIHNSKKKSSKML